MPTATLTLTRFTQAISRRRLRTIIPRLSASALDGIYDYRRGIDSGGPLSTKVLPFRKLLKEIAPIMPANPVMIDFGCGYGRPLFVAAEAGFKAARGIELDKGIFKIAQRNLEIFQSTVKPAARLHIIHGDAAEYKIKPDENIFFFCNPFGREVLATVLDHIMANLEAHPRRALMICYNSHAIGLMHKMTRFDKLVDKDIWGQRMTVLGNLLPAIA